MAETSKSAMVQVTSSLEAKWTTEEVPQGEEEIEYSVVRSGGQVIELTVIQKVEFMNL